MNNHIALVCISIACLSLLMFNKQLIGVFTNIEKVEAICFDVILLCVCGSFADLLQGYQQGIVRALGLQAKVIHINFIAYWLLNLPNSYLFAFYLDFGYKGLWMSMITTQIFLCSCFQILLWNHDWDKSAEESFQRL